MIKTLKYSFNTTNWQPSDDEWDWYLSLLDKNQRSHVTSFRFAKDAKHSLIGRVLIKLCINQMTGLRWNDIELEFNEYGKPSLKNNPNVDFNVSHSGDYVILIGMFYSNSDETLATKCFTVGCDVMKLTKINDSEQMCASELENFELVIDSQYTELEKGYIGGKLTNRERLLAFYRVWCLKEAFIKALGVGLNFDLKRGEFVFDQELDDHEHRILTGTRIIVDSVEWKNCKFTEEFIVDEGKITHLTAVCLLIDRSRVDLLNFKPDMDRFKFVQLTPDELKQKVMQIL